MRKNNEQRKASKQDRIRKGGLALTRKVSEAILSDGPVRIEVDRIAGNRVILRIVADHAVKILRAEVADRQDREAREASR